MLESGPSFRNLKSEQKPFLLEQTQQDQWDIETALVYNTHNHNFKRHCAVTQRLNHCYVTTGYPPDVLHDLLEGIVPMELALCLDIFIKKKYFSPEGLNSIIKHFPYKWKDRTTCPQGIPPNFASHKTTGGNAHENWCLLQLFPLMIGPKVPEEEQA